MAKYVDGYVLVVPSDKVEEYKKMASEGRDMWIKAGALEYFECMGEDLQVKEMGGIKPLTFPEMVKAKANETVWFSFIVYRSRAHRDEVNSKVMKEMQKSEEQCPMPFDMQRMAYGGFAVEVEGRS